MPGDCCSSCSSCLVEGICPRALITAACMVPRPVVSWPAGPTPPGEAGGELARAGGELAEPDLKRAGAGGQLAQAAVSWPPPSASWPMPTGKLRVAVCAAA